MKHSFRLILLLAGALLSGSCARQEHVPTNRQDSITWQQEQWIASGQEFLRRTDPETRAETLGAIDAALEAIAGTSQPLEDGQHWSTHRDGQEVTADFRLKEEGEPLEVSREWHRLGTEEVETVRYISIPLRGGFTIRKDGRDMADVTLDLQGRDANRDGLLGTEDELELTVEAVAADFSYALSPCRLTGGEVAFTLLFSAHDGALMRLTAQTHGLRLEKREKTLDYPYWDESFRYAETFIDADAIDLEADFPAGIHARGSVDSQPFRAALRRISPEMNEEEVRALCEEASACLHISLFYEDNLEEPRAALTILPVHILNRYDDYWTWEAGLLFPGGLSCSLEAFFNSSRYDSLKSDFRSFLQRLQVFMPYSF